MEVMVDDLEKLESWQNVAKGRAFLKKFGDRPGKMGTELINGGQVFNILPAERRLNQRAVANPKDDPFTNGHFVGIHLIEDEKDTAALKAASQGLTEDELKAIFKLSGAKFSARLEQITERVTLQRLREVGVILDAATSKVTAVAERLAELHPNSANLAAGERRTVGKVGPSRGEQAPGDPK